MSLQVSPNVVQGVLRKGYKQPRDPLGNAAWRAGVGCSAERREGADFVRGRSSDAAAAGVDMDGEDIELIAEWIVNAGPGAAHTRSYQAVDDRACITPEMPLILMI